MVFKLKLREDIYFDSACGDLREALSFKTLSSVKLPCQAPVHVLAREAGFRFSGALSG